MATTSAGAGAVATKKRSFSIGQMLLEGRAFLALILIVVVFSSLSPNYLTTNNLLIMGSHVAIFALIGMGQLVTILNSGIDLSVGSTLGFSAVVGGFMLQGVPLNFFGVTLYPSVPVVIVVSLAVGTLIGLINGVLVAKFRVAAFVATLGTLYAVRGLALLMTNGQTINNIAGDPELGNTGIEWLGFKRAFGIPMGVVVMVIVAIVLGTLLGRTRFGRWLYASGGNERAAELSGVPVTRVKIWVYVISGVCAAVAGLVLASTLTSADPTAGNTYELTAIAAVVIGGASLRGGKGNIRGTLLGAFVIGFLSDGLVIIGVSAYWQMVFIGGVIVVAVMLNSISYSGRKRS
jgi:erythritol transport system permease protein